MIYKLGDEVIITRQLTNHGFSIGEKVIIARIRKNPNPKWASPYFYPDRNSRYNGKEYKGLDSFGKLWGFWDHEIKLSVKSILKQL